MVDINEIKRCTLQAMMKDELAYARAGVERRKCLAVGIRYNQ